MLFGPGTAPSQTRLLKGYFGLYVYLLFVGVTELLDELAGVELLELCTGLLSDVLLDELCGLISAEELLEDSMIDSMLLSTVELEEISLDVLLDSTDELLDELDSTLDELSTLDEELELDSTELVSTELVLDSTELLLVSLTGCSPQPTSKTAASAAIPAIFIFFIEFPPDIFL